MKQLSIRPKIWAYSTFHAFAEAFALGACDLILTNEYIYRPIMEKEKLSCPVIFQEKYGQGEPTDEMVQAILEEMRKTDCKRIIAVGGGTIIDIAKVLVLDGGNTVDELYDNMDALTKKRKLIALPTTCGTGSEVTNIAILNRIKLGTKQGLVSEAMYADDAALVPEFLTGLPYSVFATSSIDALVHAAESYLSPKATPFTEMYSEKAMEEILQGYCRIAAKGKEAWKEEKEAYLRASAYAGIAFGNSGCAAVHAMSYAFGGKYHVPHGESNYQFFTEVLKAYEAKKPDGKIRILSCKIKTILCREGFIKEDFDGSGIDLLKELLQSVLAKQRMSDYGAEAADVDTFARSTVEHQQRLLSNNYVELTEEEIRGIYWKCM